MKQIAYLEHLEDGHNSRSVEHEFVTRDIINRVDVGGRGGAGSASDHLGGGGVHDAVVEQAVEEVLVERLAERLAAAQRLRDEGEGGDNIGDLE